MYFSLHVNSEFIYWKCETFSNDNYILILLNLKYKINTISVKHTFYNKYRVLIIQIIYINIFSMCLIVKLKKSIYK